MSTTLNFIYNWKKDKIIISNDKIKDVSKIINGDSSISEEKIKYDDVTDIQQTDKNVEENSNNSVITCVLSIIIFLAVPLLIGYKLNWFSSIEINFLGINSCYYNKIEKNALCINGKAAYFKSIKDTTYYVTYNIDDLRIEDKYDEEIILSCKKVKGSKNIICDDLEFHKK